ncbi:MAG: alpha/beta hydrolase, partial [Oscillospiraceae bacterium]|nr:alpha/beta hydrolase [Oscillospiraceae bacterium]
LYMFDGHNLFYDEDASYGKCWGIMDYFIENEVPMIIAAIECNHHSEKDPCGGRLSEYSPFDFTDRHWGKITGRGKLTMDYYVNVFKPYIDENYPTIPDREHTFISGSSMGGLMTIYALIEYNHVFSRGAALSPSVGFSPRGTREIIRNAEIERTILYMDNGSQEMEWRNAKKVFGNVTSQLIQKGVLLDSRIVPDGFHSEASWE